LPQDHSNFLVSVAAPLLAGLFGVAAGALVAWIDPSDKFSWVGLAALPLWLLLEAFLEGAVEIFGRSSKWSRIAAASAVLVGFYGAWIALRG
jgi:hypothetical protein